MPSTPAVSVNWQKFTLLALALVGMIVLVVVDQVEWADVSLLFGAIVGYGTANGIGAVKGIDPAPIFRPTNPRRRLTDSGSIAVTVDDDGSLHVVPAVLDPEAGVD